MADAIPTRRAGRDIRIALCAEDAFQTASVAAEPVVPIAVLDRHRRAPGGDARLERGIDVVIKGPRDAVACACRAASAMSFASTVTAESPCALRSAEISASGPARAPPADSPMHTIAIHDRITVPPKAPYIPPPAGQRNLLCGLGRVEWPAVFRFRRQARSRRWGDADASATRSGLSASDRDGSWPWDASARESSRPSRANFHASRLSLRPRASG